MIESVRSIFCAALIIAAAAPAFAEDDSPVREAMANIVASADLIQQGDDSLIQKYEDMPQEYSGFRRTPILFNSDTGNKPWDANSRRERDFPLLSINSLGLGNNLKAYYRKNDQGPASVLEISVDDEIVKSSLAIYQPKDRMQEAFAGDKGSSDQHLELIKTARGIAIMTLSYLDKTVAAGLATTQQQVDMDTTHQLLKQISVNMSKLANPSRSHVYDDVDEKFEACMQNVGSPGWLSSPVNAKAKDQIIFNAWDQCTNPASGGFARCGMRNNQPRYESGVPNYQFCVCCAETSSTVNPGAVGAQDDRPDPLKTENGWSLVDRALIGLKMPSGGVTDSLRAWGTARREGADYKAGFALREFAAFFRSVYCDILIATEEDSKGGPDSAYPPRGASDVTNSEKIKIRYSPPLFSVSQWVRLFRDFQNIAVNTGGTPSISPYGLSGYRGGTDCFWENQNTMWLRYCMPISEELKYGVCPAINKLADWEKANKIPAIFKTAGPAASGEDKPTLLRLWQEASLGGAVLTIADLRAIADKKGTSEGERFIRSYCDTSAVEAFRKMHTKMSSIALDYATLNRRLSNHDRQLIKDLIGRVTSQLDLGMQDSKSQVDELLIALDVERDRKKEAERSAYEASTKASRAFAQQAAEILPTFGGRIAR